MKVLEKEMTFHKYDTDTDTDTDTDIGIQELKSDRRMSQKDIDAIEAWVHAGFADGQPRGLAGA